MPGGGRYEPGLRTVVAKGDRLGLERVQAELVDQCHGGAGQEQTMPRGDIVAQDGDIGCGLMAPDDAASFQRSVGSRSQLVGQLVDGFGFDAPRFSVKTNFKRGSTSA